MLGGTIWSRTNTSDARLASRVQSVWGSEQQQTAPRGHYEVPYEEEEAITESGKTRMVKRKRQKVLPLTTVSSRIQVALDLEHRKKGLLWYSTYKVACTGEYGFQNSDYVASHDGTITFQLPGDQAIYDNLTVTVNGVAKPVVIASNAVIVATPFGPGETVRVGVRYGSQGLKQWRYSFGEKVNQVRDFQMKMTTNFFDIDFPDNTLSPTTKRTTAKGWELDWTYSNLLSGYQIAMAMPEKLQPGPLAAEISFFAPVSLLFFFFLMFIITTLRGIDLHPMNYSFLAAAFFAFHLLLAYMVDHFDIHASFVVASLVSVGLVASYMRLVVGDKFAYREAALAQIVYLVLFSYAFFLRGYTGLAIMTGAIVTLFVVMQSTGRIKWSEQFQPVARAQAAPSLAPGHQ